MIVAGDRMGVGMIVAEVVRTKVEFMMIVTAMVTVRYCQGYGYSDQGQDGGDGLWWEWKWLW